MLVLTQMVGIEAAHADANFETIDQQSAAMIGAAMGTEISFARECEQQEFPSASISRTELVVIFRSMIEVGDQMNALSERAFLEWLVVSISETHPDCQAATGRITDLWNSLGEMGFDRRELIDEIFDAE